MAGVDGEVPVRAAGVGPVFGVAAGVVGVAHGRQVLERRRAALSVRDEVVAFDQLGRAVAAVDEAAAVFGQEREPL